MIIHDTVCDANRRQPLLPEGLVVLDVVAWSQVEGYCGLGQHSFNPRVPGSIPGGPTTSELRKCRLKDRFIDLP
jgi:hypothetical protein